VRIEILPDARDDLIAGFRFYERQAPGLGKYFRESSVTDVDALLRTAALPRCSFCGMCKQQQRDRADRMELMGSAT